MVFGRQWLSWRPGGGRDLHRRAIGQRVGRVHNHAVLRAQARENFQRRSIIMADADGHQLRMAIADHADARGPSERKSSVFAGTVTEPAVAANLKWTKT